jgi:peptidoglycan/LPS O-acetylase OafA/YrhL
VLPALNGLRFVAALHVVLIHSLRARWLPVPVRSAVDAGYTSTSLFFILSGFILAWVYAGADGRLNVPPRRFLVARFSRMYPLLVASQLLVIPLWLARPHGPWERWGVVALGLSGMQAWWPRMAEVLNTPAWTLTVLTLAYALFPGMLAAVRRLPRRALLPAMGAAWLACLVPGVVFHAIGGGDAAGLQTLYTWPLLRLPEFVFGVLLGAWFAGRAPLGARASAWGAAGATLAWGGWMAVAYRFPVELIHNGLLAPVHALLIVSLASGGGAIGAALSLRPLRSMGERAIAIYLLQIPVLSWAQTLGLFPRGTMLGTAAGFAVFIAAVLAASIAAHDLYVEPVSARIRRRWSGDGPRRPVPAMDAIAGGVLAHGQRFPAEA